MPKRDSHAHNHATLQPSDDFQKIGEFLIQHNLPQNRDGNWLQPAWEYMHSHPNLDSSSLGKIGLWKDAGELVGIVNYESSLGEAFFQIHTDYASLKPEMLDYAERALYGTNDRGGRFLQVYVNDWDLEFEGEVRSRGYQRAVDCDRQMSLWPVPQPFPQIRLPEGFRITSLLEDNNLHKINRVLWRGFNHPGDPPEDILPGREQMQRAPSFRRDLNIVVVAPDGNFAAYAGTWFEPVKRLVYVEPVATDPQFRRLGLGKAAVREGIRRCSLLGAATAYVGSDQEFYLSLGFEKIFTACCWEKQLI